MNRVQFRLDHLTEYSDEAILAEIKRVATLVVPKQMTISKFKRHARVGISTVRRHFGTWRNALAVAGIEHSLDATKPLTHKMTVQLAKGMSDDDVLDVLRDVGRRLGKKSLTGEEFDQHAPISAATVSHRFHSWGIALQRAGLEPTRVQRRFSDDECFDNMLNVWTHAGRAPRLEEMSRPPSTIGVRAYFTRWGTWRKALKAFVDRINNDVGAGNDDRPAVPNNLVASGSNLHNSVPKVVEIDPRKIKLGVRYQVLKRDRFRCVLCGRNPASTPGLELHVDHIVPYASGGKTVSDNLRSTCRDCNLGKGSRVDD